MISTRSAGLVIDTVVCLALAKWETVSGRFVGYLRGPLTGFELLQALPAAQTANLRRLAILRRVGGSAAHGSWEGLGSLEGVQDQAKFGLRDYRIGRCGGSRKRRFL